MAAGRLHSLLPLLLAPMKPVGIMEEKLPDSANLSRAVSHATLARLRAISDELDVPLTKRAASRSVRDIVDEAR